MSGYITRQADFYGGNWNRVKGQPRQYIVYEFGEEDSGNLIVRTATGSFVGNIAIGVRNTMFVEGTFITTPNGSESFSFKLNDLPPFPILRFSKIQIKLNEEFIFSGYINEAPEQGTTRKKYYEFKGFGTAKRLESQVVDNQLKFDVQSISMSGSTARIYSTGTLPLGVDVNQWVIIRNCTEDSNNVSAYITAKGSNYIEILNPAGINQAITIGQFIVLPIEWSGYNAILVSDLFDQIIRTYSGDLPINYVPDKIQATTGYTTGGGKVDFDGSTMKKVFDSIKLMLGEAFDIGVDETDSFFLRAKPAQTLGQFHSGFQVQNPDIKIKLNNIINYCKVIRAKGKNEKLNTTTIGATSQDLTSQKKYGLFSKDIEVPAYMSDELCQIIADEKILNCKEPKPSILLKDLAMKYYRHGYYNVVSEQNEYIFDVDDMESLTGWNSDPSGVTTSLDSNTLISGAFSTRFDLTTSANGNTKIKSVNYKLNFVKKIFLWVYQSVNSQILTLGFGENSHTEHSHIIYPISSNAYFNVIIDVENLGLKKIGEISLTFNNLVGNSIVYIDRFQVLDYGSIYYRAYTKKNTYKFLTRKNIVDIEFGDEQPRNLEDFMSGVKSQIETSKILNKDY